MVNRELREVSGRNITLETFTPKQFDVESVDSRNSVVLINGNGATVNGKSGGVLLPYVLQAVNLSLGIKDVNTDINPLILYNGGDSKLVDRAMMQVLGTLLGRDKTKELEGSFRDLSFSGSVIDRLHSQLGSYKHSIGARRNSIFLDDLSDRFMKGCLQSTEEKTFLLVTGQEDYNSNGKFDFVGPNVDFDGIDLNRYNLVVIDNNDTLNGKESRLGSGVDTLESVSNSLVGAGLNIHLIYQTAHPLSDFSRVERDRVLSFPNTSFMPKNCAPKISRSKKVALKEIVIGEALASIESIARYFVKIERVGEEGFIKSGKNRFITFSRAVPIEIDGDEYKDRRMFEAGVEDNPVNYKMYVLSLFHTHLKDRLEDSRLKQVGKDYFDFGDVSDTISGAIPEFSERIESLREDYGRIVDHHKLLEPRVMAHNDAKWDNWFNGVILGDYGSVSPGREYKDLARALLDPTDGFDGLLNIDNTGVAVRDYIALRRKVDRDFDDSGEDLKDNVYGALVIESLRIAKYKSGMDRELTDGLIKVAETYSKLVRS
jgi:hypothetical protein